MFGGAKLNLATSAAASRARLYKWALPATPSLIAYSRTSGEMLSFGQSLVSVAGLKPRKKFHFDVVFNLQDLLNCTYVSGVLFAKIGLKDGGHFLHMSQR